MPPYEIDSANLNRLTELLLLRTKFLCVIDVAGYDPSAPSAYYESAVQLKADMPGETQRASCPQEGRRRRRCVPTKETYTDRGRSESTSIPRCEKLATVSFGADDQVWRQS
jgi:hypothetical protein